MYAIIETGGKQYRVKTGSVIQVEKLEGAIGTKLTLDKVLLASSEGEAPKLSIGSPFIKDAAVGTEILAQGRDRKIVIVKKKKRKGYKRTIGHRQEQTQLLVLSVKAGDQSAELSSTDADKIKKKFFSLLTEKGLAFTPKTQKTRVEGQAKAKRNQRGASLEAASTDAETSSATTKKKTTARAARPVKATKKTAAAKKTAKKKAQKKKMSAKKKATKKASASTATTKKTTSTTKKATSKA